MFSCCCTEAGVDGEIPITPDVSKKTVAKAQSAMLDESSDLMGQKVEESQVFEVYLDVEAEESCGVVPDVSNAVCPIVRQVTGAASTWNNACPAGMEIQRYDRILTIDGEDAVGPGVIERLLDVRGKRYMKLTLRRPIERELVLRKPGQLGISVNYKKSSMLIWMSAINEGLVASWNKANPDKAVSLDDRIVAVSGVGGDPPLLVERMRDNSDAIVLTVLSYS